MRRIKLHRGTYIALCAFACVSPIAVVVVPMAFGIRAQVSSSGVADILLALLGSFVASILTYPFGAIATVVSCLPIYFGLLTATEALLLATPLYIACGYLQWYVLIPNYFGASPRG